MYARPSFRVPSLAGLFVLSLAGCAPAERADGVQPEAGPLTAADYAAAAALLEGNVAGLVKNASVEPHWLGDTGRFWYRRDTEAGHEYVVFDAGNGEKTRAFDHDAAAAAKLGATPTSGTCTARHSNGPRRLAATPSC